MKFQVHSLYSRCTHDILKGFYSRWPDIPGSISRVDVPFRRAEGFGPRQSRKSLLVKLRTGQILKGQTDPYLLFLRHTASCFTGLHVNLFVVSFSEAPGVTLGDVSSAKNFAE